MATTLDEPHEQQEQLPTETQPPAPIDSQSGPSSDPAPALQPVPDTPHPPPQTSGACPPVQAETTDERWSIKQIRWPPLPAPGCSPRLVPVIMQNLNGPCSLLAICNILLLQGSISLPGPPDRNSVSFKTLSSILADYIVCHSAHPEHLNTALSIIPSTRTGLNLNPRFGSIDGFGPGSGEHALFSSAGVPLVHGWVVDPQDTDTWDLLVGKCGDYDQAVERVVVGEELLEKRQNHDETADQELSSGEKESIQDASVIRRFLDESRTQLSYFGLFQLASSLPHDSLAALFRNSHLSVLYRRPLIAPVPPPPIPAPLPPPPDQMDPNYSHETVLEVHAIAQSLAQVDLDSQTERQSQEDQDCVPKLFSLVTDMSFLNEPHIVWESLEDVEGGLSEFYDWDLTRSRIRARPPRPGNDPAANDRSNAPNAPVPQQAVDRDQLNSDLLCAQQLQQEEYRYQEAQRVNQRNSQQRPIPNQMPQSQSSQLVQAPPHPQRHSQSHRVSSGHHPGYQTAPGPSANSTSQGLSTMGSAHRQQVGSGSGQKKKNCVIM